MSALHLDIYGLHSFASETNTAAALRVNSPNDNLAGLLECVARLSLSPSITGKYQTSPSMHDAQRNTRLRVDHPPLSPFSDSADTHEDSDASEPEDSLASLSPAPSLYSLTESIREASIQIEHGRGVNTLSDMYRMAADEEETDRLDRLHSIMKSIMGDDVPPIKDFLDVTDTFGPRSKRTCLDIGCGSGAWILEVARRFPHVDCTAVDLVPLPALTRIPPNLRFEIDDVNLGLEHFEGHFNVVHTSHVSAGVRDYYRLISDAALALQPGGLADFTEADYRIYDLDHRPIIPTQREIWGNVQVPEGWTGTGMLRSGMETTQRAGNTAEATRSMKPSSYVARYITLVGQASRKRGGNVDASALLTRWISGHPAYEEVVSREFWLPTGPWMRNRDLIRRHPEYKDLPQDKIEVLCHQGKELRKSLLGFMSTARPLLLSTEVPEEVADYLYEKASQELMTCNEPTYLRVQNVYGIKKGSSR